MKLNRQIIICFLIFLCLLGLSSCEQKSDKSIFAKDGPIIIDCLGDSMTWGQTQHKLRSGEGIIREGTYPESLKKVLSAAYPDKDIRVNEFGINGSRVEEDSYKRITGKADIVILIYSGNNYFQGKDPEGLLEINIQAIRKQGSKVYLGTYPYYKSSYYADGFKQANEYIRRAGKNENVPVIDVEYFFDSLLGNTLNKSAEYVTRDLFCVDQCHLTSKGYELMGAYIANYLIKDNPA